MPNSLTHTNTFDAWVSARITESTLKVTAAVEQAVYAAKVALSLPASQEDVDLALLQVREGAIRYPSKIIIMGRTCREMYDDHPGLAYFYSDSNKQYSVPRPATMANCQARALELFHKLQDAANASEEHEGLFVPDYIVLKDQLGNVIHEYGSFRGLSGNYKVGWIDNLPTEDTWPALLAEASRLDSEGSVESGWDNFETARQLHEQAAEIRRRIDMAKYQSKVFA